MPRRVPRSHGDAAAAPSDLELRGLLQHIETRRVQARVRLRRAEYGPEAPRSEAAVPDASSGSVLAADWIAPELLRLKVARPPGFTFSPGESTRLELDSVRRRYTIVSAPHEPVLEFFIELVPGGRMSQRLASLRAGTRIILPSSARGGISLDRDKARHLMLATVTGVNPFVSILRDAAHHARRNLHCLLVHGASYADEFGYRDELEALAAARPDLLTYVPTVSRPAEPRNAGWQGETGRADALIDRMITRFGLDPADTAAYACGNPGMVEAARQRLGGLGYAVRTERYS